MSDSRFQTTPLRFDWRRSAHALPCAANAFHWHSTWRKWTPESHIFMRRNEGLGKWSRLHTVSGKGELMATTIAWNSGVELRYVLSRKWIWSKATEIKWRFVNQFQNLINKAREKQRGVMLHLTSWFKLWHVSQGSQALLNLRQQGYVLLGLCLVKAWSQKWRIHWERHLHDIDVSNCIQNAK